MELRWCLIILIAWKMVTKDGKVCSFSLYLLVSWYFITATGNDLRQEKGTGWQKVTLTSLNGFHCGGASWWRYTEWAGGSNGKEKALGVTITKGYRPEVNVNQWTRVRNWGECTGIGKWRLIGGGGKNSVEEACWDQDHHLLREGGERTR